MLRRALAVAMFAALLAAGAGSAATVTPVMTGLDNPRGLDFGPDGTCTWRKAAAETRPCRSGSSGGTAGLRDHGRDQPAPQRSPGEVVDGTALARSPAGGSRRKAVHRTSRSSTTRFRSSAAGRVRDDRVGGDPAARARTAGTLMGKLIKISAVTPDHRGRRPRGVRGGDESGRRTDVSNPYGLLALSRFQIVADAGANEGPAGGGGHISTLGVFRPVLTRRRSGPRPSTRCRHRSRSGPTERCTFGADRLPFLTGSPASIESGRTARGACTPPAHDRRRPGVRRHGRL